MSSLLGFLPKPAFVMAKKKKISTAGTSPKEIAEVPAVSFPFAPFLFVRETHDDDSEKLLTKMIEAMGLKRGEVYVSHEVSDMSALEKQIEAVKPKILITLGEAAAKLLLGHDAPISDIRGKTHDFRGLPVVSTFHPSFLLKNPAAKKECWDDLQFAMKAIAWKKS